MKNKVSTCRLEDVILRPVCKGKDVKEEKDILLGVKKIEIDVKKYQLNPVSKSFRFDANLSRRATLICSKMDGI